MTQLAELGVGTRIWPVPVEIEGAIPFTPDTMHTAYDSGQTHRFWHLLVQAQRVFEQFRSRFVGKASPIHLFWGSLPRWPSPASQVDPRQSTQEARRTVGHTSCWSTPAK